MDRHSFSNVITLNPDALNPDGTLKSLLEQYGEVQMRRAADESFTPGGPFVLSTDGTYTGIPALCGKPIVLSSSSLKHVIKKHAATVELITQLPSELGSYILAFEETTDKLVFVLDAKSEHNNSIIAILRTDLNMTHVEVASVRSVHGKYREGLFQNIAQAVDNGRNVFVNERTGTWAEILRSMPRERELTGEIVRYLSGCDANILAGNIQPIGAMNNGSPAAPTRPRRCAKCGSSVHQPQGESLTSANRSRQQYSTVV